jgi:hypothetical protein
LYTRTIITIHSSEHTESSVRTIYRELTEAVKTYNNLLPADGQAVLSTGNKDALNRASLAVKKLTVKLGIHRELELDSLLTVPYAEEDIQRIENFAEELANEKITGQLYTMGIPYEPIRITSSVYAATNPANKIISLDSIQADTLKHYLSNGGRRNYRSMLNYVRVHIDKKLFSVSEPEAVMKRADDVLYHMDPKKPEDEELGFNTVAGYNTFLQHNGLWKENAPRIIVTVTIVAQIRIRIFTGHITDSKIHTSHKLIHMIQT